MRFKYAKRTEGNLDLIGFFNTTPNKISGVMTVQSVYILQSIRTKTPNNIGLYIHKQTACGKLKDQVIAHPWFKARMRWANSGEPFVEGYTGT